MIRSIGFVGLGAMGSVMAPLPLKAGYSVIGFDSATTLNNNSGVCSASRLEELATCDAIILMLPDGTTVANVAKSLANAGFRGIVIDMSSSHPRGTIALAEQLGRKSIRLIDAPVSGGQKKAAIGTLMIMAGGEKEDLNKINVLLGCFGNVAHVGPLGAGHAMKALNNYVSAAGLLATMQALATAQSLGIQPETFAKVINGSTGRNNTTEVKLEPFILSRSYASGFSLQLMAKDVNIASELITNAGFNAPTTGALNNYLMTALEMLDADIDHTGLYEMVNPERN